MFRCHYDLYSDRRMFCTDDWAAPSPGTEHKARRSRWCRGARPSRTRAAILLDEHIAPDGIGWCIVNTIATDTKRRPLADHSEQCATGCAL